MVLKQMKKPNNCGLRLGKDMGGGGGVESLGSVAR